MRPGVHALLLHGAGGGAWEWDLWVPVLQAAGIAVRAIDLPHAVGAKPTRLADAVDAVADAFDQLPRPRVLLGASLGGLLAAAGAQHADGLVLVNPLPPAPWSDGPAEAPADNHGVHRWGTHARLGSTRNAVPDADPATALAAFRRWRDCPARLLQDARAARLAAPHCPMLMLVSDKDDTVEPARMRAWAAAWDMEVMSAGRASHAGALLGRDAARLAGSVARWLNGLHVVERTAT